MSFHNTLIKKPRHVDIFKKMKKLLNGRQRVLNGREWSKSTFNSSNTKHINLNTMSVQIIDETRSKSEFYKGKGKLCQKKSREL